MNILLIGGREFLGRHIIESLKSQDCHLTLFNRGKTNSHLYEKIELIKGDRQKDFHLFKNRKWDVVIDTCGYFPNDVLKMAEVLQDKVNHYIFISSCSVYDHNVETTKLDESGPIVNLDIDLNDTGWGTYGARKYLCEQNIEKYFKGRSTYIRPGLIVGPYDSTYRFPYWIDRIAEGGEILAPGYYEAPLQLLDARDLSNWIAHLARTKTVGTFNAMGPREIPITLGNFLEIAISTLNSNSKLEWVPEQLLREENVQSWSQLPLWVHKEIEDFLKRDARKAISCGLKFRPIEETITDTRNWLSSFQHDELKSSALSRQREIELLKKWNYLSD